MALGEHMLTYSSEEVGTEEGRGRELRHHLLKWGGWRRKRQESEGCDVQLLVCSNRGL